MGPWVVCGPSAVVRGNESGVVSGVRPRVTEANIGLSPLQMAQLILLNYVNLKLKKEKDQDTGLPRLREGKGGSQTHVSKEVT